MKLTTKILLLFAMIGFYGCATPISPGNLIPKHLGNEFSINNGPLHKAIYVNEVDGGSESNNIKFGDIGNVELREAISTSLKENNYLQVSNQITKYSLNIFLVEINQPQPGFTMTVTTFIRYRLIDISNKNVIFDEIINASDTKTTNDAFFGPTRNIIAMEGSLKKNIAKLIEKLFSINKELSTT